MPPPPLPKGRALTTQTSAPALYSPVDAKTSFYLSDSGLSTYAVVLILCANSRMLRLLPLSTYGVVLCARTRAWMG